MEEEEERATEEMQEPIFEDISLNVVYEQKKSLREINGIEVVEIRHKTSGILRELLIFKKSRFKLD